MRTLHKGLLLMNCLITLTLLSYILFKVAVPVSYEGQNYSYVINYGLLHSTMDIRLSDSIEGSDAYRGLLQAVSELKSGDQVTWFLVGNGGSATGLWAIQSTVDTSPAHHVAVVIGDVYSAHAYLAISMDELYITRNEDMFLYHRGSTYGNMESFCASSKGGTDRTQDKYQKCVSYFAFSTVLEDSWIEEFFKDILPKKDIQELLVGHDKLYSAAYIKAQFDKHHKIRAGQ